MAGWFLNYSCAGGTLCSGPESRKPISFFSSYTVLHADVSHHVKLPESRTVAITRLALVYAPCSEHRVKGVVFFFLFSSPMLGSILQLLPWRTRVRASYSLVLSLTVWSVYLFYLSNEEVAELTLSSLRVFEKQQASPAHPHISVSNVSISSLLLWAIYGVEYPATESSGDRPHSALGLDTASTACPTFMMSSLQSAGVTQEPSYPFPGLRLNSLRSLPAPGQPYTAQQHRKLRAPSFLKKFANATGASPANRAPEITPEVHQDLMLITEFIHAVTNESKDALQLGTCGQQFGQLTSSVLFGPAKLQFSFSNISDANARSATQTLRPSAVRPSAFHGPAVGSSAVRSSTVGLSDGSSVHLARSREPITKTPSGSELSNSG